MGINNSLVLEWLRVRGTQNQTTTTTFPLAFQTAWYAIPGTDSSSVSNAVSVCTANAYTDSLTEIKILTNHTWRQAIIVGY